MFEIKYIAATVLSFGASVAATDLQPYVTVGGIALAIVLGWRAFKVRDFSAENAGLKAAIDTHEAIKRADDELIKQQREQIKGAEARARQLELDSQKWKAAHDALVPYSAGPAFEKLEGLITRLATAGDKRHAETIDLFRRLAGEKSVNP